MISVLIVEDSPTILQYLSILVNAEPELTVIGTAVNGLDAVDKVKLLKPDVVIMDIEMPKLDGIAATRRIMAENPLPIVICSANLDQDLTEKSYRAIEAGALVAVAKPKGPGAPGV
ncbi:MAG: response regulator, partial [Pseudomonadota bacterium]|nr:response regulator [Pseudomonadota bacterium]